MTQPSRRRPRLLAALALIIGLSTWSGCGPELAPSELGEVHFEIPNVPGAESAYVLPTSPGEPAAPSGPADK